MKRNACILLIILISTAAFASQWPPKKDNEIVALDLRTGKLIWTYKPENLSDAHFEVYKQGIVAYPHYEGDRKSNALFLDSAKGTLVEPFHTDSRLYLAKSYTFWPNPMVKLSNGWVLRGFSPGNTKTLDFVDQKTKKTVWSVQTRGYPAKVTCWKDLVFYAFSPLSEEEKGILYAYQAGRGKPSWSVDLNQIVKGRTKPLSRMAFQVIEDILYIEANEHIFAFDPRTGKLHWHKDLSKQLNLPFDGGFFGGGLNLAVFAKSGNILVVSFEKRVVALDLKTERCLWHLEPDTFPHCPFPAVYDGKIFLSSGKNRQLFEIKRKRGSRQGNRIQMKRIGLEGTHGRVFYPSGYQRIAEPC